ncbi:MAG: hypothetical protein QM765_02365 [Myxococcales bacterium]
MTTTRLAALGLLAAAATLLCAAAPLETIAAAQLKGEPKMAPAGTAKALYVWTDDKGLHVRWTSDGSLALFTGSLDGNQDLDAKAVTRVNKVAGGWAALHGERMAMFSATASKEADGFDLVAPAGTVFKFEAQIDGKPIDPALVFFGANGAHAKALPAKIVR